MMVDLTVNVWVDGCCEPRNPGGQGSWAYHITYRDGEKIGVSVSDSGYIGKGPQMSNNVAEYTAVIKAAQALKRMKFADRPIRFHGDSVLTMNQLAGRWKVKAGLYIPYYRDAMREVQAFPDVKFIWVRRTENEIADDLSKKVLRKMGIQFRIQPKLA